MKIKLFTIPNMLTVANLLCGTLAVISIIRNEDYKFALLLVILAAVFDFFDGFVARLLNQCSPIGGELDSLADMVSFGLAPALVMMTMFESSTKMIDSAEWAMWGRYIPLAIVAFSALRLAKFNIDDTQSCEFEGLPTPACAIFCVGLGLLYAEGYQICGETVAASSLVLSLLLVAPIRMFALKFKGAAWQGNEVRYGFIIVSLALLVALQLHAIPLIILLYTVLSTILHIFCRKGKRAACDCDKKVENS